MLPTLPFTATPAREPLVLGLAHSSPSSPSTPGIPKTRQGALQTLMETGLLPHLPLVQAKRSPAAGQFLTETTLLCVSMVSEYFSVASHVQHEH